MVGVALVTASKLPKEAFTRGTFLGQSLSSIPKQLRPKLIVRNLNIDDRRIGLPVIYNRAIKNVSHNEFPILAFVHDDVFIHDWFLVERLYESIKKFDVIGIMGCQKADPSQVGWSVKLDSAGQRQFLPFSYLQPSGTINHFTPHHPVPEYLGPTGTSCELLDGFFMAVNLKKIQEKNIQFCERYQFHCYDTMFCRDCKKRGLKIGTWPIAMTHGSPGNFGNAWKGESEKLLDLQDRFDYSN